MTWLNWTERYFNPLEDDENYLVCCKMADGSFTLPHKAYYIEEEDRMFSFENNNAHPICCDVYMELPKVKND